MECRLHGFSKLSIAVGVLRKPNGCNRSDEYYWPSLSAHLLVRITPGVSCRRRATDGRATMPASKARRLTAAR